MLAGGRLLAVLGERVERSVPARLQLQDRSTSLPGGLSIDRAFGPAQVARSLYKRTVNKILMIDLEEPRD